MKRLTRALLTAMLLAALGLCGCSHHLLHTVHVAD